MDEIQSDPSKFVMIFRPNMVTVTSVELFPSTQVPLLSLVPATGTTRMEKTKAILEEGERDLVEVHTSGHIYADDIIDLVRDEREESDTYHTFEAEQFRNHLHNVEQLQDGQTFEI